jgi:D-alanyl-D-alanine carboxypeptidase/D-alanyl-D-alanine-endopeptidase (penicillin-binding protein 4)
MQPEQVLRAELDRLLGDPAFANAQWGVVIQSLRDGRYLYLRNENKGFMPASNMKLFTTATALAKLGPDYRYQTLVYRTGPVDSAGILNGDLVVRGSGDPSITGRYHDGNITAVFEQWADRLRELGIRRISGRVVGDDNLFEDEIMGEGWAWDYQSDWYAAQISALSFNDNCVDILFTPADSVGALVNFRLEPPTRYVRVRNEVVTVPEGQQKGVVFNRRRGTNDVLITGSLALGSGEKRDWFSVENPTLYFATVLTEVLEQHGIEVAGEPADIDSLGNYSYSTEPGFILFRHESPPLSEIVATINKVSQNLYAELLLRTLGAYTTGLGSKETGAEVMKAFVARIGIDPARMGIADGSGLSRLDLVTPMQIVVLLRYMRRHPAGDYFYDSLPLAGKDGTLRSRMHGTAAAGNARAKTGYIGRVRALSGYVTTQDGEELAFSIIANNYTVPTSKANLVQDLIVERLANYSRSP